MEIYKSKYLQIELKPEGYAFYTWLPATEDMEEKDYHHENAMILSHAQKHRILSPFVRCP